MLAPATSIRPLSDITDASGSVEAQFRNSNHVMTNTGRPILGK